MATSTVARIVDVLSVLLLFFTALATAQSVQPSNATLPPAESGSATQLGLTGAPAQRQSAFEIVPLTAAVGMGQNAASVAAITISGNLKSADPTNENNITSTDIAYISCDTGNDGGFIDPSQVVTAVANARPKAILLYSLTARACNLTGSFGYGSIYSMTSASDSSNLYDTIKSQPPTDVLGGIIQSNSTANGQGNPPSGDNPGGGPAPTTAVAMSILYSITGVITLLFLTIIATGAIRAYRNPERYGPRPAGVTGRPRQSRAKGLARAMLETLPIVKFGDPEPLKPGNRDIELEDGNASVHAPPEVVAVAETGAEPKERPTATEVESGLGPQTNAASTNNGKEPDAVPPVELGCSICTEDFVAGEDVRVLPCNHKYHPACIDPWLLNVSGTCPLCRHDLRPPQPEGAEGAEDDELPPPLFPHEGADDGTEHHGEHEADTHQRRGVTRLFDLAGLRHAPPEERIAALRRLREQSRREGNAQDSEETHMGARLTGHLRDVLRIRTRPQHDAAPE